MSGGVLALVPARGGSKGVPRKNLAVLGGRTLLDHAIDVALAAERVDVVAVSTDDDEIAEVARRPGVVVIDRPEDLASDHAPTGPVAVHALDAVGEPIDHVVLLQPPAPVREAADVDAVVDRLVGDPGLDAVVSVVRVEDDHPGRMYECDDGGVLRPLFPPWERARRQDLPPVFHRNGAIYAVRAEALRTTGEFLTGAIAAYEMSNEFLVNIDSPRDLLVAQLIWDEWIQSRQRS